MAMRFTPPMDVRAERTIMPNTAPYEDIYSMCQPPAASHSV